MSTWVLKFLHVLGLSNLSDEQVARYVALKQPPKISFSESPAAVKVQARPKITFDSGSILYKFPAHEAH